VDQLDDQELIMSLRAGHGFGSARLSKRLSVSVLELVRRSASCAGYWQLPSLNAVTPSPELLVAATWHSLSVQPGNFCEALGSLLLVTVESAQQMPPELCGKEFVVRVFLVGEGEEPEDDAVPAAQSTPFKAAVGPPEEQGGGLVERLQEKNFNGGDGSESTSSRAGLLNIAARDAAAREEYSASDQDRGRRRLRRLWQHFRTKDGGNMSDWATRDRSACLRQLGDMLGIPDSYTLNTLVDEMLQEHPSPGDTSWSRRWTSASSSSPGTVSSGPRVECHWNQQLRVHSQSLRLKDVWIDVSRTDRRGLENLSGSSVVGAWRRPLSELLVAPGMCDKMRARPLVIGLPQEDASGKDQAVTLFAKLEMLHLEVAPDAMELGGFGKASPLQTTSQRPAPTLRAAGLQAARGPLWRSCLGFPPAEVDNEAAVWHPKIE